MTASPLWESEGFLSSREKTRDVRAKIGQRFWGENAQKITHEYYDLLQKISGSFPSLTNGSLSKQAIAGLAIGGCFSPAQTTTQEKSAIDIAMRKDLFRRLVRYHVIQSAIYKRDIALDVSGRAAWEYQNHLYFIKCFSSSATDRGIAPKQSTPHIKAWETYAAHLQNVYKTNTFG